MVLPSMDTGSQSPESILVLRNVKIQIYSGITSGRVLNGELLYTEILEVTLFAFVYGLFHEDFSPVYQMQIN